MLKKTQRLDRYAFSGYFSKGRRSHGLYTTIIYCPGEVFLCSVVVGKKVSKKAPVRNNIRRRVYSLVEKLSSERNLKGAYIIIVKPEAILLSKKAFATFVSEEVGTVLK